MFFHSRERIELESLRRQEVDSLRARVERLEKALLELQGATPLDLQDVERRLEVLETGLAKQHLEVLNQAEKVARQLTQREAKRPKEDPVAEVEAPNGRPTGTSTTAHLADRFRRF